MSTALIVIGVSWGGLEALQTLLRGLPKDFPVPIVIVQHRSKEGDAGLAQVLQRSAVLPVVELFDKEPMAAGTVYLAPPDYHVLIERGAFALSVDPPVTRARPSIDVLFESAAIVYGPKLLAVILTGAGRDGVRGLLAVKAAGGRAVVQDPATAEARMLPDAAILACVPDDVVPLKELASFLVRTCAKPSTATG